MGPEREVVMCCPTCDHTMEAISDTPATRPIWHCPRCGTVRVRTYTGDPKNWHVADYVPNLVARCREFEEALANPAAGAVAANLRLLWHTAGIDESINKPEDRP